MQLSLLITLITAAFFSFSDVRANDPIETVPYVNLEEYMGDWYEVARYENSFQRKCQAVRVKYTLKNNYVKVLNQCQNKNSPDKIINAKGLAFVKDQQTNAKLKVSFAPFFKYLGFFAGDYWIMELDQDYQYALIGTPDMKFLWIISRTPTLSEDILEHLYSIALKNGFEREKIIKTPVWN